jgi:hypothetical protein
MKHALLVLVLSTVLGPLAAVAGDFRVQSKVFVGKQAVESTTIFRSGVIYDFLTAPSEITVCYPHGHRFVVLDPQRQVKTELSAEQIEAFVQRNQQRVKKAALEENMPLAAFLAEPDFDESYDESSGELELKSAWMTYRVKTVAPKFDDAAAQYVDYTNWQAKLNTLIKPGSMPPFARLALNGALKQHDRLPIEVELTRYAQQSSKKSTIRAEHKIQWRLVDSDLKRLDEADNDLTAFKSVSLHEYYRREAAANAEAQASAPENDNAGQPRTLPDPSE